MKKIMRNKGFTLVELLAVLVVLAILAVITIPVVTKVINKTKNSSYELSISAYGKAAENGIMAWAVEHQTGVYEIVNGWNDFVSVYGIFIETKGEEVTCTDAKVTKEGKLSLYGCSTKDSKKEHKYYSYVKGKTKLIDNITSTFEYNVGDIITYKGIEWYVIAPSDEREDSVKLLKKEYLTAGEVNYYGNGIIYRGSSHNGWTAYYESDTCNDSDQTGCINDYALSQVKIIVDGWSRDKLDYNDLVEDENGYKARLITKKEFITINSKSWKGNSYWTMTFDDSSVTQTGFIDFYGFNNNNVFVLKQIRPVIELSKSAIQK